MSPVMERGGWAIRLALAVALAAACDGRDHAVQPDGGRVKKDAGGGVVDGAAGAAAAAAGSAGESAVDAAGGAADVPASAPPDASPDLSGVTNACAANMKSCNGACIAAGACCVDGDCPGSCQQCGSDHACTAAKRTDDPTGRCSGTCDPAGKCKSKQGQHCTSATSDGCLGGAPCVDGYCCNATCAGSCVACDVAGAEGTCTAVISGPPHGNHPQCTGAGTACGGSCGGRADGACVYPTSKCGAATCSGMDKVIGQGICSGGTCNPPQAETCANSLACVSGACRTTCAANSDCQPGFTCSKGACFRALKVVSGQLHSCVLLSDHTVRCWGDNPSNQLGRAGQGSFLPVLVGGLTGVSDISAGKQHTCAIVESGAVRCWGDNSVGQFGNATVGGNSATPTIVNGVGGATAIFAGHEATCAVVSGGAVMCWGNIPFPGNGAAGTTNTPVQAVGLSGVTAVAVGPGHICALQGGEVWCWGDNQSGKVGQPLDMFMLPSPKKVGLGAVAVAAYADASCAVGTDGNVKCWGLAINGSNVSSTPTNVPGTEGSVGVGVGEDFACAISSSGLVKCWGANDRGQLGVDRATSIGQPSPGAAVTGLSGVVQFGAGLDHACTVTSEGTVRCWGANIQGQCGAASPGVAFPPTTVSAW
jgi:alpha-tubulin suppressor-like RCC1 family protein